MKPAEPVVQTEDSIWRRPAWLLAGLIALLGISATAAAVLRRGPAAEGAQPVAESAAVTAAPLGERSAAGPSPVAIAEEYFAHWDAGEVAEYEALVAPEANLFTQGAAGEVAIESWYRIATGVELDRTCDLAGEGRVRCETTLVSGLQPGVVIAEAKPVVLSIRDGVIVDFQFPRGFQTVYDDDIVGLDAYREWMARHEPGEFKQLFLFPKTIVVNSEEARSRHREMIVKFLESATAAS